MARFHRETNKEESIWSLWQTDRRTDGQTDRVNDKKQTVNDGVAHSMNPRKCAYHVTFDLDLDLEHTLDARLPGDHRVQVWWRSGHLPARRSDLRKSLQTDGRTDRRRTPRHGHCISSFLEWANNNNRFLGQARRTTDDMQFMMGHPLTQACSSSSSSSRLVVGQAAK